MIKLYRQSLQKINPMRCPMLFQSAVVSEGYKVLKKERIVRRPDFGHMNVVCHCARNDVACAQVLLFSDRDMTICMSDSPAFYEGGLEDVIRIRCTGGTVRDDQITMFRVGLMEDDDRNLKADPLWREEYFHAEKCQTHAVFIRIAIPSDFAAGEHRIAVALYRGSGFQDEELRESLSFVLKVYDFVMPDPPGWEFHLDLWQHNCNIARKHETALWSEEHFEVIEEYVKTLAELGQKVVTVIASQIPWCGQLAFQMDRDAADMYEYSCIGIRLAANGSWKYDFSVLDRLLEIYSRHGIDREIELFGLAGIWTFPEDGYGPLIAGYQEGIRLRYFDESSGVYRYIHSLDAFAEYLAALECHFIDKGLIGRVRVVADEPSDIGQFRITLDIIRKAAPLFQFKAAINHIGFIGEDIGALTDYVPILPHACTHITRLRELKAERPGSRFCTYVCCWPPFPNTFLCSPLSESRNLPWLIRYLGLDGLLRWNFTVWPKDPRRSILYRFWPAGDTNFVYPGNDGRPVLSLRYFCLRRGIRDYELMRLCGSLPGGDALVGQAYETVFMFDEPSKLYSENAQPQELYSLQYDVYENAAGKLLGFLEKNSVMRDG